MFSVWPPDGKSKSFPKVVNCTSDLPSNLFCPFYIKHSPLKVALPLLSFLWGAEVSRVNPMPLLGGGSAPFEVVLICKLLPSLSLWNHSQQLLQNRRRRRNHGRALCPQCCKHEVQICRETTSARHVYTANTPADTHGAEAHTGTNLQKVRRRNTHTHSRGCELETQPALY